MLNSLSYSIPPSPVNAAAPSTTIHTGGVSGIDIPAGALAACSRLRCRHLLQSSVETVITLVQNVLLVMQVVRSVEKGAHFAKACRGRKINRG